MRLVLSLLLLCHCAVQAVELPGIPPFIDEMVARHQFKRDELEKAFARARHRPDVIEAISRPATAIPWEQYRANFVNERRIRFGLEFWHKYRVTLQRAEQQYGVPQEVVVAVIGVETVYGANQGKHRVLDALTTLAFDYPRRAPFFRSELENFLLLAREQQFDLLATRGSYAGAMGVPQFMPSSYRNHAVDFNGNSKIDLLREDRDAIGSVANYLKNHGWVRGAPVAAPVKTGKEACPGATGTTRTLAGWAVDRIAPEGEHPPAMNARLLDFTVGGGKEFWLAFDNFEVIRRYNNSDFYVMSVFQLAEAIKQARH